MAYFDPKKETDLITDASLIGLSAILVQKTARTNKKRVVAYVSRALTPVERQYSQTEKEALAIVWPKEKLHIYLYGSHLIFNNPQSRAPAGIEHCNIRLQGSTLKWHILRELKIHPITYHDTQVLMKRDRAL